MTLYRVPVILLFTSVVSLEGPKVKTTNGWVQGGFTQTRGGRQIVEFLGIPYAQPPVDDLRLKSPVPMSPWDGVRDATKECDVCIQQFVLVEALRNTVSGSEDCLCINIYTPSVTTAKKLPVIFWIHGGAYMGMSPQKSFYGPQMLLDKDVVLVTVAYRLGVMGFLTTGDDVIPGNFGMKDQALALRWVKDNIAQFGGDCSSITLAGESSGAASVYLHMVSPLTKGLFHRAILGSGSGLCPWGYSEPEILIEQTKKVAQLVGCPFGDSKALLSCLQKSTAAKIVDTTKSFVEFYNDPLAFWNPTAEKTTVKDAFLTESPWKSTPISIPILTGFNYAEGFKTFNLVMGDSAQKFKEWNAEFDQITPMSLRYKDTAPYPQAVTTALRAYYFGSKDKQITRDMTAQITRLYGDAWINNAVLDTVERHQGPKYLYYFAYNQTKSVVPSILQTSLYLGASHMDELMYLFPMSEIDPKLQKADPTNPDYLLSQKMVELWTTFATTSKPTAPGVAWDPVQTSQLEYLYITNSGTSMKKSTFKEMRQFWKTLKLRK